LNCLAAGNPSRPGLKLMRRLVEIGLKAKKSDFVRPLSGARRKMPRAREVLMITAGFYSLWFRTPVGKGVSFVELEDNGKLGGRDATFAYAGQWKQDDERFEATVSAKPIARDVSGTDAFDIVLVGQPDGEGSAFCVGFIKQSPDFRFDVAVVRMNDIAHAW
jgi:hypothetical protein